MISQQAFLPLRRQRHKRQIDQLALPIELELSQSLYYQQYLTLSVLHESIAGTIQAMRHEVYDITEAHCDTIMVAFQELLLAVGNCISVLSGPDLPVESRPYLLIMKLSALHRMLIEVQVTVGNVRGQCRYGCLASDPTGSYWKLRGSLRDVVRDYQSLLTLLKQEHIPIFCPMYQQQHDSDIARV